MTIFGLSLVQVFLLVLVVALAIVVAEQIRKHGLDPFLASVKAGLSKAEVTGLAEGKLLLADFEKLLGHAKTTAATLPAGSTVNASSGKNTVAITTGVVDPTSVPHTPIDPVQAVKRYIAGGMTPANGMPNLYELLWLFKDLSESARFAWGIAVAAAFDAQLAPAAPGTSVLTATVGDIGGPLPNVPGIRVEAQVYLLEVGSGFPIVGTCNWTKS
jgi:hypothetical protein